MQAYDFDLLVIGAGSAGVRAARLAAAMGKKVAICEQQFFGGTCVNIGCVPKKLLVYAADFAEQFRAAAGFGWQVSGKQFDWVQLIANKDKEIDRLQAVYQKLLSDSGATIIRGHAQIIAPHQVRVQQQQYSAERILIATGCRPVVPEITGSELGLVSDDMFYLRQLPSSMAIVGAGYIGVEFAGIMSRLGVQVTLIDKYALPLNGFDMEARRFLAEQMQQNGIHLLSQQRLLAVKQQQDELELSLQDGHSVRCQAVLFATGRRPNTEQLGLDAVNVACESDGRIRVNQQFQTNIASIYALGDVANSLQLTPVALADATRWVNLIYGDASKTVPSAMPTAIFSHPEYACVGLSEEQAQQQLGSDIRIFTSQFRPMKHTLTGLSHRVWMKLIVQASSDRVLGAHMIGESAAEIMQGIAVAISAGARKADFDQTLGIHPTAAEEFVTMRQATR